MKKISVAVKTGICTLLPVCRDVARLQSEALDQKLSFSKRFGLSLHLLLCKWCRRYGKQIQFLQQAAREHPENLSQSVPQRLSDGARERIKQRLKTGE